MLTSLDRNGEPNLSGRQALVSPWELCHFVAGENPGTGLAGPGLAACPQAVCINSRLPMLPTVDVSQRCKGRLILRVFSTQLILWAVCCLLCTISRSGARGRQESNHSHPLSSPSIWVEGGESLLGVGLRARAAGAALGLAVPARGSGGLSVGCGEQVWAGRPVSTCGCVLETVRSALSGVAGGRPGRGAGPGPLWASGLLLGPLTGAPTRSFLLRLLSREEGS